MTERQWLICTACALVLKQWPGLILTRFIPLFQRSNLLPLPPNRDRCLGDPFKKFRDNVKQTFEKSRYRADNRTALPPSSPLRNLSSCRNAYEDLLISRCLLLAACYSHRKYQNLCALEFDRHGKVHSNLYAGYMSLKHSRTTVRA